jgi:AmmeMemoRadiSam system protein A
MTADLTQGLRERLLRLARRTIEAELRALPPDDEPEVLELRRPGGAFVTLKRRKDGSLRGCVGIPQPLYPLDSAVARAAIGAAFRDPRFPPVVVGELPGLSVHVSALSTLETIEADAVVVGVHGLLVRWGGRSGLLLPQVAVAEGWDRETFLAHTCLKAGLPADTWRAPGCEILGFTAVAFGEAPE